MAKKLKVDKSACVGCGACYGAFPNVFTSDADGKAEVTGTIEDADAQNAIDSCPAGAISNE